MPNSFNRQGYFSQVLASRWMILVFLLAILQMPAKAYAYADDVADILKLDEEPSGVVIEIVEKDEGALALLLPEIWHIVEQLHGKFPAMHIAVVSHGREQFALKKSETEKHKDIHDGIRQLVAKNIDVHVCGTHASWYNVEPEDFPDYVDVAPAGPAQINDYRKLGYILIQL